ncbi:MAG TPA: ATP-binding protein [Terriglobales bacterium]|nr:ATP-binding protein [Terriglobales bacterium]
MPLLLLGRDFTVRRFTPRAEKIFNLLASDVGRQFRSLRHTLDCPDLDALLAEVVETVSVREREVRDSEGRWYSLRARPYLTLDNRIDGVVIMLVDIDALKRSQQAIEAANNYSQAILRTARDPLVVLRPDLTLNTANEAFYKMIESTPELTEGRSLFELAGGAWDVPRLRSLLREVLPGNRAFSDFEMTHEFPGKRRRSLVLDARPLTGADGSAECILLAMQDITEHVEGEAREKMGREAEAANRTKDAFLANLSHELRTPLHAMLGWTSLLRSGECREADFREGLEVIERNCKLQTRLIDDVMDVSRIAAGKMTLRSQPCDLAEIIRAAMEVVRTAAESRNISIQTGLDPAATQSYCDPGRMQQVIWNLLSNAIKFTPPGGKVEVTLATDGGVNRITVRDAGQGIPEEFLPFVFDRFRQADSSTRRSMGGLGLGLAIVKHLVELHGGTVEAHSEGRGKGAAFTIELPIRVSAAEAFAEEANHDGRRDTAPRVETAQVEAPPLRLEGVRVLLVDDDPDARRMLAKALTNAGAVVAVAGSVAEALDVVHRAGSGAGAAITVLVSDLAMPGMDGFDLIQRIRNGGTTAEILPAIALTAFAGSADARRALEAGFQAHASKPIAPRELIAAIAELKARKRTATEL